MKTLSNEDIERILQGPHFGGVLNKDDLTRLENKNYVFNLDRENGPGTHWICISNTNPLYVFYFDSFGCAPPEHLLKLMEVTGKRVIWNKLVIQSLASNSCGEFCSMFLRQVEHGFTPHDVIRQFRNGPDRNEELLRNYFVGSNMSRYL